MYRHLFSSRAEVTVTGDASSSGRRALVVSVSHAGGEVKPVSLSAAIDISPQLDMGDAVVPINDGPGPLASTVLIQQIKQAGATKKVQVRRPFFLFFSFLFFHPIFGLCALLLQLP
ncbi:unnamed protein product [Laminaria digitata]